MRQQLLFYGHIARLPDNNILRRSILTPNHVRTAHYNFRRKRTPRRYYHNHVFTTALRIAGELTALHSLLKIKQHGNHPNTE